jgi:hypothetical protein
MELYNPGPDGNSGDNWNEDPRGVDAKSSRGADAKVIDSQN